MCNEIWTTDRLCDLVARLPCYSRRGPGFDFRRYQIFGVAVNLERGPLSLVRINEGLLERKISDSGVENWDLTAVGVPPRWPHDTPLSVEVGIKIRRPMAVAQSV
jgi:hypothetical protein